MYLFNLSLILHDDSVLRFFRSQAWFNQVWILRMYYKLKIWIVFSIVFTFSPVFHWFRNSGIWTFDYICWLLIILVSFINSISLKVNLTIGLLFCLILIKVFFLGYNRHYKRNFYNGIALGFRIGYSRNLRNRPF
jgi:hypothetical protein